jgi:hypothetical protein
VLTALPADPAGSLRAQVCRPGELAVIPPGAWHLTAVLDGPAELFSISTELGEPAATGLRSRPNVRVTAAARLDGFALTGPDLVLGRPVPTVTAPEELRAAVPAAGLAALHRTGSDEEHAELLRVLAAEQDPR